MKSQFHNLTVTALSGFNSSLEIFTYHTAVIECLSRNPVVSDFVHFSHAVYRCCVVLHVALGSWLTNNNLTWKYRTVGLTHLPCTIVVFSTPSGSTTVSSSSCSSRFSFCSMVVCVNSGAWDDTHGPCTTAGGRGALFLDDLLQKTECKWGDFGQR